MQPCRLPPTRCALSIGPCACRCSRASSPQRARRCRSPAPYTTPTHCSGTTGLSASRPARPLRPAAASPSGPSAGSTASGRRSPGSCWASPATTRSRRVSRPPTPWSTGSPVIHGAKHPLCQIYGNEPWHHEPPSPLDPDLELVRDRDLVHRSAHRLLDELRDPGLVCLSQLLQRERDGPHGAVVELRAVVVAEHRVPLLEHRG